MLEVETGPIGSHDVGSETSYIRMAGLVRGVPQIRSFDVDEDSYLLGGPSFEVIENWDWDDEAMYCMPLFVCHRDSFTFAECLLLEELYPGGSGYFRVGLLKVSLDKEANELPVEIGWVARYSMSQLLDREQKVVSIY